MLTSQYSHILAADIENNSAFLPHSTGKVKGLYECSCLPSCSKADSPISVQACSLLTKVTASAKCWANRPPRDVRLIVLARWCRSASANGLVVVPLGSVDRREIPLSSPPVQSAVRDAFTCLLVQLVQFRVRFHQIREQN